MQARFFYTIILLLFYLTDYSMTPAALKGTYEVFSDGSQHLSPLHGALLWESGVVRHYYDAAMGTELQVGTWLPPVDGPIRLARALFTDTSGNFDISNNPNYPAKHLGISTLASIIALLEIDRRQPAALDGHLLEDLIIRDPEFAQSVDTINHEYEVVRGNYETLIKQAESLGQEEQVVQLKYSSTRALSKLYTQRLCRDWSRQQRIMHMKARIAEIDTLKGSEKQRAQKECAQKERELSALQKTKTGGDYNRVYELAQAIIDAHKPSPYYSRYSADWLLLTAAYRKAKSKQDLISFITLLTQKLGAHMCKPIDKAFESTSYTAADYDAVKQRISSGSQLAVPDSMDAATYEAVACAQIVERYYKGPFPKVTEYANVSIHGATFPDCVEITLFYFCNMVLYDRLAGIFDIGRAPASAPAQAMVDFYHDPVNKQAANSGLFAVRQSWDVLLQNWPLVTYRTLVLDNADGSQTVLTASKDTNGFIYGLPEKILSQLKHDGERVLIGGRWYIHVTKPHAYLCEMHPTIRNVILALTRLFNLDLFNQVPVEQAFLSDRFNASYFPRLCEYFNLLRGMRWTDSLLTALDKNEYTDPGILLSFTHFDLLLTDEHAEIIVNIKGDNIADLGPQLAKSVSKHPSMGQLLKIFPFQIDQLPGVNPYHYLLYLPLHNNQIKINVILFCIQKLLDQQLSQEDRIYLTDRVIGFMRQLPERLDWHYHQELMLKLDPRAFDLEFMRREIERILSIAKSRLAGISADCEYAPSLYLALIEHGQQRDDVMLVIDNLLARTDQFDRKPLLNLLITMVKQGKAIAQAGKAVDQCIHNTVPAERVLAGTLRDMLPK